MALVYSVEQINTYIKNMFNSDFLLNRVSVKGEVSNCKYHSSGHIYFTIKDKNNTLSAVMFAGNRTGLKFKLEDGMQIIATGNISIYETAGKYQLYAKSIEKQGEGELYKRFLQLKKDLEEMGMFDPMYKKQIPLYAKTIGIVTAKTGAAIQDIINISKRRNPYIKLVLYPAQVQGNGAEDSICKGIHALENYGVDIIIVGRGGGAIEDLWAFNDERVARTIFDCKIPIISAVGHETDFTIADFVADLRAPTPSAAAELAVCDMTAIERRISEYKSNLYKQMCDKLFYLRNRCDDYKNRFVLLSPTNALNQKRQKLDDLYDLLNRNMMNILNDRRNKLSAICKGFEGLSPVHRLSAGYSYTENKNGKAITSINEVSIGENIIINVLDGQIDAKIEALLDKRRI